MAKAKKKIVKKVSKKPVVKKPVKKSAKKSVPKTAFKILDVSQFVTPLDDRMIVQVSGGEKQTPGGLYIPDTVSNVSGHREGVVLSVGRGHRDAKGKLRPMDVKTGDKVVFTEYSGSKIQYQGQDLVILRETEVMGVLD